MDLGDIVETGLPCGQGVVSDLAYGEALVRLDSGSVLDMNHGRWFPMEQLTVTGHDPEAKVWRGSRLTRAGN